eukprot:gnl/TRDRNA2_/TRDRNA2_86854_c0_seq1.p1 gnl/TRDRNA2_/TRDRNA2_86854_c0~~gnl/TRDRNA2_/TRDRNA2_86854_c0_seq1.p1  ORF type:complete len:233 (-),score=30.38 gnl/TRDRNA2_/TRDRNA2_86854_c0_seq1:103-720(-)
MAAQLQHKVQKHAAFFRDTFTHTECSVFNAFILRPQYYFKEADKDTSELLLRQRHSELVEALKQMKQAFASNLSVSQGQETTNQKLYEDLKAAYQEDVAAAQRQIEIKTTQLVETDENKAQAMEAFEDTTHKLHTNVAFLGMLKFQCWAIHSEREERQSIRLMKKGALWKSRGRLSCCYIVLFCALVFALPEAVSGIVAEQFLAF